MIIRTIIPHERFVLEDESGVIYERDASGIVIELDLQNPGVFKMCITCAAAHTDDNISLEGIEDNLRREMSRLLDLGDELGRTVKQEQQALVQLQEQQAALHDSQSASKPQKPKRVN